VVAVGMVVFLSINLECMCALHLCKPSVSLIIVSINNTFNSMHHTWEYQLNASEILKTLSNTAELDPCSCSIVIYLNWNSNSDHQAIVFFFPGLI
jgi:hypothetical protein